MSKRVKGSGLIERFRISGVLWSATYLLSASDLMVAIMRRSMAPSDTQAELRMARKRIGTASCVMASSGV